MGVASAAGAVGLGARAPIEVVAALGAGAALAAAVRALIGDSPASLAGAALAPLLLVAMLFDAHGAALARPALAIAAAAWTVVELSRPSTSPLVACLPAVVAAVLEPGFVALVAFAGTRLMTAPWRRPRWAIVGPLAGGLALLLALLAGTAKTGVFGGLGRHWFGPAAPVAPAQLAATAAAHLGPIVAVAAVAGLASLARARHAELSVLACALGAVLVALRAGHPGPALLGVAAITAALAVAHLASLIRLAPGQACAGATASLLLLLPPAWSAVERGGARVSSASAAR
jgi:hypothetical protein